jgi:hypothetical protein
MAVIAAVPAAGSWLIFWTLGRRRPAVKPTCRSAGRFAEPLGDDEVAAIVDHGLGAQCPPFLVVLLTSRHHHRPSAAYGLAQGITLDEAGQIVLPLTCSSPSPPPNGSRQLTDAGVDLYKHDASPPRAPGLRSSPARAASIAARRS